MSFSTFIGLFLGISIVISAMSMGSSILIFVNLPGLMIVIGGTVAATMIRYSLKEAIHAIGMSFRVLLPSNDIKDKNELVDLTEDLLRLSRKDGFLVLDKYEVNHDFYRHGVRMLVDGYSKEVIKRSLMEENKIFVERATTSAGVFASIGGAAPAFGMIGTLVGLIQMLSNLSDPSSIGPAMAVAMLTTLYGAMIANLFALPMADKINTWVQEESVRQFMIIEGLMAISEGRNPGMMRELLSPYLENKPSSEEVIA
ncbi:MotA/TolQ/ExbB proton channel family protein [Hydrogenovibrio sp. 3SP14C1]|uniref:motility protein A n=1 Tax=Hydrogenovibrio sp. 3SP14C1 TaxID=3038774 RepID=UPI002415C4C4|nr:MotA/TolQ/ExbB proton channel family protein [Hydrogenovibrio sp. 3SP14C1]MDG4813375.1 MotA/TolQ/ExbB proton channel family protein [Hydrogenovibrio sp. 3SP14C1]